MNTVELATLPTKPTKLPGEGKSVDSTWSDWVGIVASVGCAIHCAAMPFVIAYLPMLGLSFLADEAFHQWMALICFLVAIAAFVPGIRRHGNWTPISVGAFGLAFITYAAFGLAGECCPTCADAQQFAGVEAPCADSTCEQCDDCNSTEDPFAKDSDTQLVSHQTSVESAVESNDLMSTLAPWLTPFGGLLLVSAHLMNRRFGSACRCGCCQASPSSESAETSA